MTARDNITGHYGGDGEIRRRIYEQLHLSGLTDDHTLSPSDLSAVDQFHVGGLEAMQELARLFSPSRGCYVLDIGSGFIPPREVFGRQHYRSPNLNACVRVREPWEHDANYRIFLAIYPNPLSHYTYICCEAVPPKTITKQYDVLPAFREFGTYIWKRNHWLFRDARSKTDWHPLVR
jgi:hypothetical protein